jgi:TrkA domain protein
MDVHIREAQLPGVGTRYEIDFDDGRTLAVVARRDGRRELHTRDRDGDTAEQLLSLEPRHAAALGALLLGARVEREVPDGGDTGADEALAETVTLSARSPLVGQSVEEGSLPPDLDAALLAIIRDDTPALVEHSSTALRVGDRLVVALRRGDLLRVTRHLRGGA